MIGVQGLLGGVCVWQFCQLMFYCFCYFVGNVSIRCQQDYLGIWVVFSLGEQVRSDEIWCCVVVCDYQYFRWFGWYIDSCVVEMLVDLMFGFGYKGVVGVKNFIYFWYGFVVEGQSGNCLCVVDVKDFLYVIQLCCIEDFISDGWW